MGRKKRCYKKYILIIFLICSCGLAGCSLEGNIKYPETPYTVTLKSEDITPMMSNYYGGNELIYETPEAVVESIKKQGEYDAVTIPIAWCFVEEEQGEYDYSMYQPVFDAITENGYKMIVVLDAGGRSILKNGVVERKSIPDWVWDIYPEAASLDFYGNTKSAFDYFSEEHIGVVLDFFEHTIDWLNTYYREDIVAMTPAIMGEFEIKFEQTDYMWESYTDNAKSCFQKYLSDKHMSIAQLNQEFGTTYHDFDEIELPVIDYNNTIASINFGESFLFTEWMECREEQIVTYTKFFTDMIHSKNFKTIGYFGQFMFPSDAIYATGVVAKCRELFDIAVIDYNFYDGYKEVYNADIPAFMVNLVSNLGYEKVFAGLYFERVSLDGRETFVRTLNENLITDGHSSGFEIGSLSRNTSDEVTFVLPTSKKAEKSKVAIYTSEWNYYKTHGEAEEYLDYISNSAVELFHILEFELGIPVEIISDYNVSNGELDAYKLVFLPFQIYVPEESRIAIMEYAKNGGKLIQDFRFAEFDSYGRITEQDGRVIFGLAAQNSVGENVVINSLGDFQNDFGLMSIYKNIPVCYTYALEQNDKNLFSTDKYGDVGALTDHTLTWGFQPQLQYLLSRDRRYIQFINESVLLLSK